MESKKIILKERITKKRGKHIYVKLPFSKDMKVVGLDPTTL